MGTSPTEPHPPSEAHPAAVHIAQANRGSRKRRRTAENIPRRVYRTTFDRPQIFLAPNPTHFRPQSSAPARAPTIHLHTSTAMLDNIVRLQHIPRVKPSVNPFTSLLTRAC